MEAGISGTRERISGTGEQRSTPASSQSRHPALVAPP